ncbi:hypothetical protein G7Y89_g5758 [Cudoniella acicularis]|uniref:Uncharacterized protein n=1 Tax=Cudoniella acicularis TaxID=354080 RepID=A0A8H4W670_9HELO|nr:hypothetical protein G7Y89_g5758 [Cudoniella acicularis]
MNGAISRVAAALATVHNENAVSLANLNFDFTLIKMEVPPEFRAVGSTMSEDRKANAEDGTVHKTARKLGALFESIIPATPELYKAYGTRVSELSQSTKINPKPSPRDGMFASHIGVDSTSLWAAVTSGDGAIGVHLLACMLARIWTGPQAISIWHELVTKRKLEIQRQCAAAAYPSKFDNDVLAATQEISREMLAGWDASARAWVQSADEAEFRRHTQLMLILDNLHVPVNDANDLYQSVTAAWFAALQAMENLVKGVPQQVQDGAALLGMSSWHLYPDMVVLGGVTAEVKQKDALFPPSSILTLGLQFADQSRHGVSWSLPLAHLRYYGHPVQSSCSISPANSRISMDQFAYVILGCIFGGWKEYGLTPIVGTSWLLRLHEVLEKFPKRLEDAPRVNLSTSARHPEHTSETRAVNTIEANNSWMGWLFNAGQKLLETKGLERKIAMQLVALGRRRTAALCPDQQLPSPLFGLSDPSILIPIMSGEEERIKFLRGVATKLKLEATRHIIRYKRESFIMMNLCPFEYATARPLLIPKVQDENAHRRFLPVTAYHQNYAVLSCICFPLCTESCPCRLRRTECSTLCHYHNVTINDCGNISTLDFLRRRRNKLLEMGEASEPLCELLPYNDRVFATDVLIKFSSHDSFEGALIDLSRRSSGAPLRDIVGLELVCGDPETAAIFKIDHTRNVLAPGARAKEESIPVKSYVEQELLADVLQVDMLNFDRLIQWLTTFRKPSPFPTGPPISSHTSTTRTASKSQIPSLHNDPSYMQYSSSLRAALTATQIYRLLPDATISTTIVSQSLWLSKWLPTKHMDSCHLLCEVELTRAQAFACIAMFDSGSCNLEPAGLHEAFAISSGNSIYVAAPLLCDPFEVPAPREIRRVTGNVGRPGLTILVPPGEPQCRTRDDESWYHINHQPFDGRLENCFQQTTIHLAFTAYELPLSDGSHGQHIIDRPANLVETVVSVHDRGKWIADLDVLSALNQRGGKAGRLSSLKCSCREHRSNKRKAMPNFSEIFGSKGSLLISIDNWEEFLDLPSGSILVVKAYQNWLARLAFTVMSVNHGQRTMVLSEDVCWLCCKESIDHAIHQDIRSSVLIC